MAPRKTPANKGITRKSKSNASPRGGAGKRIRSDEGDKPYRKSGGARTSKGGRDEKSFGRSAGRGEKPARGAGRFNREEKSDKPFRKTGTRKFEGREEKPSRGAGRFSRDEKSDKPFRKTGTRKFEGREEKPSRGAGRFSRDEKETRPVRRGSRFDREERTEKPFRKTGARSESREDKPFGKKFDNSREERPSRGTKDSKFSGERRDRKNDRGGDRYDKKPAFRERDERKNWRDERPDIEFVELDEKAKSKRVPRVKEEAEIKVKPSKSAGKTREVAEEMRLNRFLANAGICSRRDADKLIESGVITVNGKVMDELGYRVQPGDVVKYNGSVVKGEKQVYLLMNKPKDHITTMDDPEGRKTVMDIVSNSVQERVFPVGRLDRNTTGVLIMTNDGDLAQKLTHPKYQINKIYMAVLDKKLAPSHMEVIASGFELEDGYIQPDAIAYVENEDHKHIGIEIHSGRNRIIHRVFEHFGYKVEKLDRVSYAGLTKKDLKRGDWRFLTEKEVGELRRIVNRKTPKGR